MCKRKENMEEAIKAVKEHYLGKHGDYGGISSDEVTYYLLHKIDKGTNTLKNLTIVLIVSTIIMATLAGIQIWQTIIQ